MKIWSAPFLLFVSISLYGQGYDSLVLFNEINFSSDFEKQVFLDVGKGKADPFSLFMANGNLLTDAKIAESKTKFYEYINSLKIDDIKKNEKRVKSVYDYIEKKYLKKFEVKNRFEEVFYNGYFNSISAGAVFALTLDKLKIPYTIKEEEARVYLVAYPFEEKVVINSVPEMGGYFQLDDSFKQQYIKRLKEQKVIPESEYNASSLKDLFDKYYFDNGADINVIQLAGIQYTNDALFLSAENKHETAFNQMQKAFTLYPSDRNAYLLMVMGISAFESHKTKDSLQAFQLARLARYSDYGVDHDMIVGEFSQTTQKLLFTDNARTKYEMYYRVLNRNLRNARISNEVAFIYSYEYGRYYYSQGRYAEALPLLEKSLELKSADVDTQTLFLGAAANAYGKLSNTEVIPKIESYNTRFPTLRTNNNFNLMMASVYLVEFYQLYVQGKTVAGDKYKVSFEKCMAEHPDLALNSNMVGQAYSTAAVYYYRKGQVAKAKQLIANGLKYAPNNYELKSRQSMIK